MASALRGAQREPPLVFDDGWEESASGKEFQVVNPDRVPELPGRELRFCQDLSSGSAVAPGRSL